MPNMNAPAVETCASLARGGAAACAAAAADWPGRLLAPAAGPPPAPGRHRSGGAAPATAGLPRIGLALGGGAARGFAHIGVIQALEESGIGRTWSSAPRPAAWSRALYASGSAARARRAWPTAMDESAFTDWAFPAAG